MLRVFYFQLCSLVAKLPSQPAHGNSSGSPPDPMRQFAKGTLGSAFLCLLLMSPETNARIRSGTITGLATDRLGGLQCAESHRAERSAWPP
jgi:hypothetical protein